MAARVPVLFRAWTRISTARGSSSVSVCRGRTEFWPLRGRKIHDLKSLYTRRVSTKPTNVCRQYSDLTPTREGLLTSYQNLTKLGRLQSGDQAQEKVAEALDKLCQDLSQDDDYRWLPKQVLRTLWSLPLRHRQRGMYIHGGVGRGKTMLMDLFYEKVNNSRKHRVHFHSFMLDVHTRLHHLLKMEPDTPAANSLKRVALQLVQEARLLCLDEVEVTDIADALILRRLFAELWPLGMVVVATSNLAPEQLYRNGLNRHLFEPFIKQLKEHCCVYSLDSGHSIDYRRSFSKLHQLFMHPLAEENDRAMDKAFVTLTGGHTGNVVQIPIIMGRQLQILAAEGVARTSFEFLCGGPHGAVDYITIAKHFRVLFLDRIPWLGDHEAENEARRFITLIDILYQENVLLICSAQVAIEELLKEKPDAERIREQTSKKADLNVTGQGGSSGRSTLMIGHMEWSATGRTGVSLAQLAGTLPFTRIAAPRAVSRLLEMQSKNYILKAGAYGNIVLSKFYGEVL